MTLVNFRLLAIAGLMALVVLSSRATALAVPVPSASGPIQVEIEPHPARAGWCISVLVRFRNTSDRALSILRPLDGSTHGWYMPIYRFHVYDESHRELPLFERCGVSGLWDKTTWPDSFLVRLDPGQSVVVPMDLPFEVPDDGFYRVWLEYIYQPDLRGGTLHGDGFALPPDAWVGDAWSNTLLIDRGGPEEMRAKALHDNLTSVSWLGIPELAAAQAENRLARRRQVVSQFAEDFASVRAALDRPAAAFERMQVLMLIWKPIGYTTADLEQVLGPPTESSDTSWEYRYPDQGGWEFAVAGETVTQVSEFAR